MSERTERIRNRLMGALSPSHIEIIDDSAAHAGHAGARETGGGHFSATIVAEVFEGQNSLARHKMVYAALGDLLQTDIHAFSMKLLSPAEFKSI